MNVTPGAGGIVFDSAGQVLLIRHLDGTWVFPKGHIDAGENALQTALREVEEEAGITSSCADPETSFTTSYVNAHGENRRISWFVLHTTASAPLMREELFPEGRFMPPDEALDLLAYSEDRRLLAVVLEHRQASG